MTAQQFMPSKDIKKRPDNFLTTKQAAQELGVTARRVRALIEKGRLNATKFGRSWLIEKSDLDVVRTRKPGRPQSA